MLRTGTVWARVGVSKLGKPWLLELGDLAVCGVRRYSGSCEPARAAAPACSISCRPPSKNPRSSFSPDVRMSDPWVMLFLWRSGAGACGVYAAGDCVAEVCCRLWGEVV